MCLGEGGGGLPCSFGTGSGFVGGGELRKCVNLSAALVGVTLLSPESAGGGLYGKGFGGGCFPTERGGGREGGSKGGMGGGGDDVS